VATITITVPDTVATEVVEALCHAGGQQPTGTLATDLETAANVLVAHLVRTVQNVQYAAALAPPAMPAPVAGIRVGVAP